MRGGRCEGVVCGRGSAERGSPPLTIDKLLERRVVGVGSRPYSGEACGSRTMPEVHSGPLLEIRRLDGRLFFLDSDGLMRSSGSIGVVGGVEKVSASGEADAKVEVMLKLRSFCWFTHPGLGCHLKYHLLTCIDRLSASNHRHQTP